MVAERGAGEAAALAQGTELDVGLHVTLSDGFALEHVRPLTDAGGRFRQHPAQAGLAYWFRQGLRPLVQREVEAQFRRFSSLRQPCSHVDGHQHLHIHPVVWRAVTRCCREYGVRWVRVPFEEWRPMGRVPVSRPIEWAAIRAVGGWCRRQALSEGLRVADRVYGLVLSGQMTEERLIATLRTLQSGVSEVYAHPGVNEDELDAVCSERVRDVIRKSGLILTGFSGVP